MTNKTLGTKFGLIALIGSLPLGCADDITNPFANETDATGTTGTTGTAGADDADDDGGTTSTGGTTAADTMALDDTGTTAVGTGGTDESSGGSTGDSGTTGGSDSGTTGDTGEESGSSSTGDPIPSIPCPGDAIPTDMGLPVTVNGSSVNQDSEFGGTCGGGGAPEYTWTFTAPADGDYLFDTAGSTFDTVMYVLDGECMGEELACDDDGLASTSQSLTSVSLVEDQTVTVVVDAFGLSGGNITLTAGVGSVACPAEEITTVPSTTTGQTMIATDNFSGSCGAGSSADQGYLFTAPQDGTFTFETVNNDFDTLLYLVDGNCEGAELACNNDLAGSLNGASGLTYPMAMGEQVTVVVDGWFGSGNFDLEIGVLEGDCPDADLGNMAAPFTVSGSTTGQDNAAASTCGGLASEDFAWTWTAPATSTYRFATENSDFDTVVYIRDGNDCLGAELGCNNDTGLGTDASAIATVQADDTVTIIVDGNGAAGNFDLVVDVDCPAQDMGSTVPQTITDSTIVSSDQFVPSCGIGGGGDQGFTFTAPADGTYIFETANNDFNTVLFVLDAICGGNELACNDDAPGAIDGHSELSVMLTQDQTVTLGVEGFFGATGTFDLSVTQM